MDEEMFFSNYSGREINLRDFKPKANLEDIVIATICNCQDEAECEADFGFYYAIYHHNNTLYVDYCQVNESNESWMGNTDYTETTIYATNLATIENVSTIDFINIIIDYQRYMKEYIFCFGNNRMSKLHFQIDKITEEKLVKAKSEDLANSLLRMLIEYRI